MTDPPTSLGELLDRARTADRSVRIELRDPIASFGEAALEPMADWIDDEELSRFAVRVIERIARQEGMLKRASSVLVAARADAPTDDIANDIDSTLDRLGTRLLTVRNRSAARPAPTGTPGHPGRRYWAFRTTTRFPEFIWAEVRRGRLRQGWGYSDDQDLRQIAARVRSGVDLSIDERKAWRGRKMLTTERDGVQYGDLVVTQNLPRQGHLSVCRVIGSYDFGIPDHPHDFGHILPVELLVEDVDRGSDRVSDGLRHAISLRPRIYDISPYGGDVEALVARR